MLSSFSIANFKAFGPAQEIPIRPITLIFGPNSAGKSSIIQSLLLARHIHDTGNADAHQTTLGGAAVDLGGFGKFVRSHDGSLNTSIHFAFARSKYWRKFDYLDRFQTLRVTYAIGMAASGQPSSDVGIRSVTFWLDGCELVHFVRAASGELHVDASGLLERSLLSVENLWEPEAFVRWNSGAKRPPIFRNPERLDREASYKEAALRELREMKFGATLGAFVNLGKLTQPESPNDHGNTYGFYLQHALLGYAEGTKLQKWEGETKALAMALRYEFERLVEAAGAAVQQALRAVSYLGPLRWIPPRLIPDGEQFDASWKAGGGDGWQRLRREPELLDRVNRFLQETLHSQYRLRCQNLAPELDAETIALCVKRALESSAAASAGSTADEPSTARVAEDAPPSVHAKAGSSDLAAALQSELRAQTSGEGLTELSLVDDESGLAVSHRDVGTGISQLLPVLVNAAGGKKQLIAIEQPELHLHPALQAELGDVFIESALGGNENKFLIETHSEHLILRLLRRIRESNAGKQPAGSPPIRPEDIAVLFVQPTENGAVVKHLRVDKQGRLVDPWPGGFFGEAFDEMF